MAGNMKDIGTTAVAGACMGDGVRVGANATGRESDGGNGGGTKRLCPAPACCTGDAGDGAKGGLADIGVAVLGATAGE